MKKNMVFLSLWLVLTLLTFSMTGPEIFTFPLIFGAMGGGIIMVVIGYFVIGMWFFWFFYVFYQVIKENKIL